MYTIAICDDEPLFSSSLADLCQDCLQELNIPCSIDQFNSSKELLQALSADSNTYQLLLLDIMIDELDGIALAHRIRERNQHVTIVFVTVNADYSLQGYSVRAYDYLLKPVSRAALKRLFLEDYRHNERAQTITLKTGTNYRKIALAQITHLEILGRKVAIHLADETLYDNQKLSEWEPLLPADCFVRCHQSFILNITHVYELNRTEAITHARVTIPISRKYLPHVQKAFLNQLSGNL